MLGMFDLNNYRRDPETGEPIELEPHYPGSAVDAPSGDLASLDAAFPQEGDE